MSRYPIDALRSHVDDRNDVGGRIFSRDCPEYVILLPGDERLVVIPNRFKSKRGGDDGKAQARRQLQAETAANIARNAVETVAPMVLLGGDLNDTLDSQSLHALWMIDFEDVQQHPDYPTDRPGTYATGTAGSKSDYLIMSSALRAKLVTCGIERRGTYHPRLWNSFDTVRKAADEASDHHLVWADFDV